MLKPRAYGHKPRLWQGHSMSSIACGKKAWFHLPPCREAMSLLPAAWSGFVQLSWSPACTHSSLQQQLNLGSKAGLGSLKEPIPWVVRTEKEQWAAQGGCREVGRVLCPCWCSGPCSAKQCSHCLWLQWMWHLTLRSLGASWTCRLEC